MHYPSSFPPRPFSRSLKSVLRQQEKAQDILQQARKLRAITAVLSEQLPEYIRAHCQAGYLDEKYLVLIVDNSAWATQLRYLVPQLKKQLIQNGLLNEQQAVRIKVVHEVSSKRLSTLPPPLPLSRNNAALLRNTADSMADDELKSALLKLSRRIK